MVDQSCIEVLPYGEILRVFAFGERHIEVKAVLGKTREQLWDVDHRKKFVR